MHLHFLSLQKTKKPKAAESVSPPAASEGRCCSPKQAEGRSSCPGWAASLTVLLLQSPQGRPE